MAVDGHQDPYSGDRADSGRFSERQEEGMKRLLAILTLACVVLVLPGVTDAADRARGQAALTVPVPADDRPVPGGVPGGSGSDVMDTMGDPDELGGGFRGGASPPTTAGLSTGSGTLLEAIRLLALRLL
jgi:hypothetical protein